MTRTHRLRRALGTATHASGQYQSKTKHAPSNVAQTMNTTSNEKMATLDKQQQHVNDHHL